jgi:hypothetical protein
MPDGKIIEEWKRQEDQRAYECAEVRKQCEAAMQDVVRLVLAETQAGLKEADVQSSILDYRGCVQFRTTGRPHR